MFNLRPTCYLFDYGGEYENFYTRHLRVFLSDVDAETKVIGECEVDFCVDVLIGVEVGVGVVDVVVVVLVVVVDVNGLCVWYL